MPQATKRAPSAFPHYHSTNGDLFHPIGTSAAVWPHLLMAMLAAIAGSTTRKGGPGGIVSKVPVIARISRVLTQDAPRTNVARFTGKLIPTCFYDLLSAVQLQT